MESNKPIQLPQTRAIIKSAGLRAELESLTVGSHVTNEFALNFAGVFEPEDFSVIPSMEYIQSWEVVKPPQIRSGKLPQVKERAVLRPVWTPEIAADIANNVLSQKDLNGLINSRQSYAMRTATEDRVQSTIRANQSALETIMNKFQTVNSELPLDKLRQTSIDTNITANLTGTPMTISDFYGYGSQSSLTYGEAERLMNFFKTGSTDGLPMSKVSSGNGTGLNLEAEMKHLSSFLVGNEYATYTSTIFSNQQSNLFGTKTVTADFFNPSVTYTDTDYKKYQSLIGSSYGPKVATFVQDNLVDTLGLETFNNMISSIDSVATQMGHRHGLHARKEFDSAGNRIRYGDYDDDIFAESITELEKTNKKAFDYVYGMSNLMDYEELELQAESQHLLSEMTPVQVRDHINQKREEKIRSNMVGQLRAVYDTYKEDRNDFRASLANPDARAASEGIESSEADNIYNDRKQYDRILEENEKSDKRLLYSSFEEVDDIDPETGQVRIDEKTGLPKKKLQLIKSRASQRPTDKMVMEAQKRLNEGESVLLSEAYKIGQLSSESEVDEQIKYITGLMKDPSLAGNAENELLERHLSDLYSMKNNIAALSKEHYMLDMEGKSFQEALADSWKAMIEGGRQSVEIAKAKQAEASERIKAIGKEVPETIMDFHGFSRKQAAGLRASLANPQLSFLEALDQTIKGLDAFGSDVEPSDKAALSTVFAERDKVVEQLKTAVISEHLLRAEFNTPAYSVAEYRSLQPESIGIVGKVESTDFFYEQEIFETDTPEEKARKKAENKKIRLKRYYQDVRYGLNGAYMSIPMLGNYIDEAIENVNLSEQTERHYRLEQALEEKRNAEAVIRSNGYDPQAMGRTIAENGSVYQIGITSEQYNEFFKDPSKIETDVEKVGNHKVLVQSKKKISNVTSWLDAERSGFIISGGYEDTVGYKVKISGDQKIAYLTRPAIKTSDLQFGDLGLSNETVINAVENGLLDADITPTNLVIDKNPNTSTDPNDFVTLRIDETTRKLFQAEVWDEKVEGYVRNDIDAIFDGKEPRGYNIKDDALEMVKEARGKWETVFNKHKEFFSGLAEENETSLKEHKELQAVQSSLRAEYSKVKQDIAELNRQSITANEENARLIANQIDDLNQRLNYIEVTSKSMNENMQLLSETIANQVTTIGNARKIYATGEHIEGFAHSDLLVEMHNQRAHQDVLKEEVFQKIKGMHAEKEANRLSRIAGTLETLQLDPADFENSTDQIRLTRGEFVDRFLQDASDNSSVFNSRLKKFMGAQFTHIDPDDYGTAAAAMLDLFNDASSYGKEYDLTSGNYAVKALNDVSAGTAHTVDMLTKEQASDYHARITAFDNMAPLERLQQVMFEDMKRYVVGELYAKENLAPVSKFEHTILRYADVLKEAYGEGDVSAYMVYEDMMDQYRMDANSLPKGIQRITLEEVARVLDIRQDASPVFTTADGDQIDLINNARDDYERRLESESVARYAREQYEDDVLGKAVYDYDRRYELNQDEIYEAISKSGKEIETYNQYADAKLENAKQTKGVIYNKWIAEKISDHKAFLQNERSAQIEALKELVATKERQKKPIQMLSNALQQMFDPIEDHVKFKQLPDAIEDMAFVLENDYRWQQLANGDNPYYKNVIRQMRTLRKGIKESGANGYNDHIKGLANQFKALRTFSVVSLIDPALASEMIPLRSLTSILGEGEIANRAVQNATENLLSQMLTIAESEGKTLNATIQVPGEDFETSVEIRRREDGALEAYSHDLKQGYIVNDSGQGNTATARTETTRAYARNNNIAAIETASKSHAPLRVAVPTHEMSKRKGNAMNISNITSNFVDAIQYAKDGAVMMGYDIETTMTGAKHLENLIQPIDIFAEKFQFNEAGELIKDSEGRNAIATTIQEFVEDANGNTEYISRDVNRHSSFSAIIALNDQSKQLINDLSEDSSRFMVKMPGGQSLHIASIADKLEWKANMSDTETQEYNRRKNEFFDENLKGKKKDVDRAKTQINKGLEELRFLSNVAKYSMAVDERGSAIDGLVGSDASKNMGAFELYSKNKAVSSYDDILDSLKNSYASKAEVKGLNNQLLEGIFKMEDGKVVRAVPNSALENLAVSNVQKEQTRMLIQAAQKAAEILDSASLSKENFGQEIQHFTNEADAINAFRKFGEADDVAAILGSNTEKADNVTLLKRMIVDSKLKYDTKDGFMQVTDAADLFNGIKDDLTKQRNELLNSTLSEITGEYYSKFVVSPKNAEKFRAELAKKQETGTNINAYLNKKKSIVVSDLSEALNYLPLMTNESININPSSQLVKDVDKELHEKTHLYDSIVSRSSESLTDRDKELLGGFKQLSGVKYNLDDYTVEKPTDAGLLRDFFNRLSVIDQQVLARSMYPELRSLSNEGLMVKRGVSTTDAHASNTDTRHGIDLLADMVKDAYRSMNGEEVQFEGVDAVVKSLGITADMENINEAQRLRKGDFVYLRESYGKETKDALSIGQVGVYQVDSMNSDMTGMQLVRYTMGANGMIPDTSVPALQFQEATNALFENEVVNKIRFISDQNDEKVKLMGETYFKDISRQHIGSALDSTNEYYIKQHQVNVMSKMFENNPLFDLGNGASLIDASNDKGMIPVPNSPVDALEKIGNQYNAIMNSESVMGVKNNDGLIEFDVAGERYAVPTHRKNAVKLPTVNILGTNVDTRVTPTTVNGETQYSVQLNPKQSVTPDHLSDSAYDTVQNIYRSRNSPSESRDFFVDSITKEHASSLKDLMKFNNTELGRQTRQLMDDVTALESIGEIDGKSNAKTDIISAWHEEIKAKADELGAYRSPEGMAQLQNVDYIRKPTQEEVGAMELLGEKKEFRGAIEKATINTSTPVDAVNSINRLSGRINKDLGTQIHGADNKMTFIANEYVLPSLKSHGLLPADYNDGNKGLVSLEKLGLDIFNHAQEHGISSPVKNVDYLKLANIMEDNDRATDFADTFRKTYIDPKLDAMSENKRVEFEEAKINLGRSLDEGRYVPGLNIAVPVEPNTAGSVTLSEFNSKSFFKTWSVDDLINTADSLVGTTGTQNERLNTQIYGELAKRASGGIKDRAGIDPQAIIDSGDINRITAAEHLGWIEQANTRLNGQPAYRAVEDMLDHKITYTKRAGMTYRDLHHDDYVRALSQHKYSPQEQYNSAVYHQFQKMKQAYDSGQLNYDTSINRVTSKKHIGGVNPEELSAANEQIIRDAENYERPRVVAPDSLIAESVSGQQKPLTVADFSTPVNNVGSDGRPLINSTTSIPSESGTDVVERVIEKPTLGRPLSEAEAFIGDTKSLIHDKMKTFLNGSSGGKWVAGIGVAAAALFTVNSMGGPLRLEDRPQGHGVKGFAGAPEDDNRTQRETKSVQVDTSSKAYVNSGDSGYTIQAKGRAGSNIDTGQLQNAVSGMQGASSVNVNIRDDRSSIDSNWLESQFSNYINRGYAGE